MPLAQCLAHCKFPISGVINIPLLIFNYEIQTSKHIFNPFPPSSPILKYLPSSCFLWLLRATVSTLEAKPLLEMPQTKGAQFIL